MYKNDLSAAHARIRSLESALAAQSPSIKSQPPKQQAPPRRRVSATGNRRFPLYYERPASYWPLVRGFVHALRTNDMSLPYPRPTTNGLFEWLLWAAAWPFMRLVFPVFAWVLYIFVAIPAILVSLIPLSIALVPVAFLAGLKLSNVPAQRRHDLWTGRAKPMPMWEQFVVFGVMADMTLGMMLLPVWIMY